MQAFTMCHGQPNSYLNAFSNHLNCSIYVSTPVV